MSILHVNQISSKLKDLFGGALDLSDISEKDQEIELKVLSRSLAAYAVYNFLGCSIQDAADSVVDGGDDNGIDAIYYSASLKQIIIVQSKWIKSGSGEPDSAEIGKFCQGVRDLFNLNFDRFNDKVQKKQTAIIRALEEYDTKYTLLLVDTGDKGLAEHSQRLIDDLLYVMNDAGEGVTEYLVSFERLNQGKIHASLALSAGTSPIDLEIGLSQWGKINEPHGAYFGMVAGEEIAQWWTSFGRRLFDKNIRQVLGNTEVNEEIKNTLANSPDKFWYFNNGITIVADKIEKSMIGGSSRESGAFKLSGASIVNGAQTVSTIGKYFDGGKQGLDKVWVQAKLISLVDSPEPFGALVTKTNNRQNKIENRDFVSQDPEQMRIKTELAIDGIDYSIVRSESFKLSETSFDLNEATIALACSSDQVKLAVQAKREIGKFYEDLTKGLYKSIFNPQISGRYVYNSVKIARLVDASLTIKTLNLAKKSGKKFGLLVHGNRLIALLVNKRLDLSNRAKSIDFELNTEEIIETVLQVYNDVYQYIQANYKDSVLGTLFKNVTKCSDIYQNCL